MKIRHVHLVKGGKNDCLLSTLIITAFVTRKVLCGASYIPMETVITAPSPYTQHETKFVQMKNILKVFNLLNIPCSILRH